MYAEFTLIDLSQLADAANHDAEFALAARYWATRLEIVIGDRAAELLILDGRIVEVGKTGSFGTELDVIRLRAAEDVWRRLLSPRPGPGWQDPHWIRDFDFHGNVLDRAPYYAAVRRLLDLMRLQLHGPAEGPTVADSDRLFDDPVGRYVYVDVQGVQYRVYFEESGSGIPMLMQHTAGTSGLQWRHVLADRDYQKDFRLIAYDLPFHGKSLPPTSQTWWAQDYMPTRSWLIDFILGLSRALELERPVFMGCSIGGLLAPVLAAEHSDEFRAVIGVNSGMSDRPPSPDRIDPSAEAPGIQPPLYFHPRVANDWKSAAMMGLMTPDSPEAFQRETAWLYASEAPPVYYGDVRSYRSEFRLSEDAARAIDTSKVGVYMLTGEYDPFALDGAADRLADLIPGVSHAKILSAGHFAPSDNPAAFKKALDPVLQAIAAAAPE